MSNFFTEHYKKYLDELETNSHMLESSSNVQNEVDNINRELNNLSLQISSSSWKESGKRELSDSYMENIRNKFLILTKGIVSLKEVTSLAISTLLVKLKALKEKNTEFNNIVKELDLMGSAPNQYNMFGVETSEYQVYVNKFNELTSLKNRVESEANQLISEIDSTVHKINSISVSKIENKFLSKDDDNYRYMKSDQSHNYLLSNNMLVKKDGRMLNYGEYSVVDTPFGVADFYNYIQKNKIYQDGSDAQNSCFSVAHLYGKSLLMNKKYKGTLAEQIHSSGGDILYKNSRLNVENKQTALEAIYDELKAGRPVTIDVKRKKPGGRHVVTVVGFKSKVKSASELRSEDLLILDTWDGQIERMDTNSSRIMASGAEVSQGYNGYRVNRVGEEKLNEVEMARQENGIYG